MKLKIIMIALFIITMARAQEVIDTAQFVAIYDYECRTLNDEETPVTDKMQIAVQVGNRVTKSMPRSAYQPSDTKGKADIAAAYQDAMMHMPTIWIGSPQGHTTVREFIFPHEFEGFEPTPDIQWTLLEDTATVSGYLCQQATATFRGVEWRVCYTEEIPSSAGPWRLRGLPGLIIKAESAAHTFLLAELQQAATPITFPEHTVDVQRMEYAKMLTHKNRLYGNKQYAKNPTYYINYADDISHMEVFKYNDQKFVYANGHPLLVKAHVYQPLEVEQVWKDS